MALTVHPLIATCCIQDNEVIINARKEAGLINPETNNFLELDIYIPSLKLALEYQVSSHRPNLHFPLSHFIPHITAYLGVTSLCKQSIHIRSFGRVQSARQNQTRPGQGKGHHSCSDPLLVGWQKRKVLPLDAE